MSAPSPARTRFSTLDGLRGLAAVLVMLFHAGWQAPVPVPGGYLAVDLFFALSGFVLARAYEDRFRSGYGYADFIVDRLVRVAPMAILGSTISILIWGGRPEGILLVPDFGSDENLFPSNPPMWSLLFELIVNAVWGLLAVRVGWTGIVLVLAISGGLLVEAIWFRGAAIDLGSFWFTLVPGLARTVFSFTVGLTLFKVWDSLGTIPRPTRFAWLLFPALVLLLALAPAHRAAWDTFCIFAALPALLWLAIHWDLPKPGIGGFMGDLSFPLYCIHVPIIALYHESGVGMACLLALLILAASALDRWIDRPVRAAFTRLRQRPAAPVLPRPLP